MPYLVNSNCSLLADYWMHRLSLMWWSKEFIMPHTFCGKLYPAMPYMSRFAESIEDSLRLSLLAEILYSEKIQCEFNLPPGYV